MKIILYGDPALRRKAQPVERITNDIKQLANGMVRALTLQKGYGLAAPQVAVSQRLVVVDVADHFAIVVNPKIVDASEEKVLGIEGCLSLPGAHAEVWRHQQVCVRGLTLEGAPFEVKADELLARVYQHEIDHLDGVLFIDYLGEAKRLQTLKEYERGLREQEVSA